MADIELIVKMPEEMWERVKEGYVPLGICKYLMNSLPLPKGHGRLIDAGDLMPDSDYEDGIFYAVSIRQINDTDTIIKADKQSEG